MSQPTICIGDDVDFSPFRHRYAKIYPGLDNGERVCETERFPTREKNFSDGAWCMERLHDRPFQDFVAHETHRLSPRSSTMMRRESLIIVTLPQGGRSRCGRRVFRERNP